MAHGVLDNRSLVYTCAGIKKNPTTNTSISRKQFNGLEQKIISDY